MSTAITRAPAFAIASAMPSPMPEPAPVTSATRPASNPFMISSLRAIKRDREMGHIGPGRVHRECLTRALGRHVQERRERLAGGAHVELIAARLSGNASPDTAGPFKPSARERATALHDAAGEFDLVAVARATQIELNAVAGLFRNVFGEALHAFVQPVRRVDGPGSRPGTRQDLERPGSLRARRRREQDQCQRGCRECRTGGRVGSQRHDHDLVRRMRGELHIIGRCGASSTARWPRRARLHYYCGRTGTGATMAWRIGVDIGGTFTDVALVDDASGRIGVAKVPTTPADLADGVLAALGIAMERHGVAAADVGLLSHATTVVTNAILEERGARAALVTT